MQTFGIGFDEDSMLTTLKRVLGKERWKSGKIQTCNSTQITSWQTMRPGMWHSRQPADGSRHQRLPGEYRVQVVISPKAEKTDGDEESLNYRVLIILPTNIYAQLHTRYKFCYNFVDPQRADNRQGLDSFDEIDVI